MVTARGRLRRARAAGRSKERELRLRRRGIGERRSKLPRWRWGPQWRRDAGASEGHAAQARDVGREAGEGRGERSGQAAGGEAVGDLVAGEVSLWLEVGEDLTCGPPTEGREKGQMSPFKWFREGKKS